MFIARVADDKKHLHLGATRKLKFIDESKFMFVQQDLPFRRRRDSIARRSNHDVAAGGRGDAVGSRDRDIVAGRSRVSRRRAGAEGTGHSF